MTEQAQPLGFEELLAPPATGQVLLWARHLMRLPPLLDAAIEPGGLELVDVCGKAIATEPLERHRPAPDDLRKTVREQLGKALPSPEDWIAEVGESELEKLGADRRLHLVLANCAIANQIRERIEPQPEFLQHNLPRTGLPSAARPKPVTAAFWPLAEMMRADARQLTAKEFRPMPSAWVEFLGQPLWPGATSWQSLPAPWPELVERFAALTRRHRMGALHEEYLALVAGEPLDWQAVDKRLAAWLDRVKPAKRARRRKRREPPPPSRPNLRMLDDGALEDDSGDRLDFRVYADAIAGLIDNPDTGTPLTMAINGPWGSGKTTLAKMVQRRLEQKPAAAGDRPHVTCWFNAWLHDEAEQLAAAFAAEVAKAADRHRSPWRRLVSPLPVSILPPSERLARRLRIGASIVAVAVGVALLIVRILDWELLEKLASAIVSAGGLDLGSLVEGRTGQLALVLVALLTVGRWVATTAGSLSQFIRDPAATASAGAMDRVREQLGELIRQATPAGSRFVVFIDDLERCRPPGPVDVLEVVNQLLPDEGIVTVVIADMPAVIACAEIKYRELAERYQPGGRPAGKDRSRLGVYGRFYLQKMIQLQFDLPRQRSQTIREMLDVHVADPSEPQTAAEPPAAEPAAPVELLPGFAGLVERGWRPGFSVGGMRNAIAAGEDRVQRVAGYALWLFHLPLVWVTARAANLAYRPPQLPAAKSSRLAWIRGLRLLSLVAYVAGLLGGAVLGLSPAARAALAGALGVAWWWVALGLAVLGIVAGGLFAWIEARLQRRLDKRQLAEARRIARQKVDEGVADTTELAAAVAKGARLEAAAGGAAIAQEAVHLQLVNESELMAEAWKTVLVYLPRLPRSAKRLLNHLRLTLFIAHGRGIFGGRPVLRPAHVGKWVVLRERWPELAQRLTREPDRLAALESAVANPRGFEAVLALLEVETRSVEALREFCGKSPKNLGKVLRRLIHFQRLSVRSG